MSYSQINDLIKAVKSEKFTKIIKMTTDVVVSVAATVEKVQQ